MLDLRKARRGIGATRPISLRFESARFPYTFSALMLTATVLSGGEAHPHRLGESAFLSPNAATMSVRSSESRPRTVKDAADTTGAGRNVRRAVRQSPAGWPHEPAGLTLFSDQKWSSLDGWTLAENEARNTVITSRADSPFQDKMALQYHQPIGMLGGGGGGTPGPGSANFAFRGRARPTEIFVGVWIKVGSPYTPPPSTGQKLWYVQDAAGSSGNAGLMWVEFYGTPGAANLRERPHVALINQMSRDSYLYEPNLTQTELRVGSWHQYEMYFRLPTTASSNNGVLKVWIDGIPNISLTNVPGLFKGARAFDSIHQDMQWGGGGVMRQDQYIWATHNRISGR